MAKSTKTNIDLITGIHIRIEGEAGKTQGLSAATLVDMVTHFQNLLKLLAKYNLKTNFQADLRDFEIEIFDFRPGSAVPAFRFRPMYIPSLDDELVQQRVDVSEAFTKLMSIADKGNYEQIKKVYELPEVTSDIAKELFQFTYSTGTSPISIVKPIRGNKFKTVYKVQRPKRRQISALIINGTTRFKTIEETNNEVFGKILVKALPGGKKQRKIKELYEGKDNAMSFAPSHITAPEVTYHLHSPLMCLLFKEEEYFVIQAELYDLYAAGPTEQEAEVNFYKEFDIAYKRFTETPDSQLSDRLLRAKQAIKLIVKEITND
jgi:hypothetical protein